MESVLSVYKIKVNKDVCVEVVTIFLFRVFAIISLRFMNMGLGRGGSSLYSYPNVLGSNASLPLKSQVRLLKCLLVLSHRFKCFSFSENNVKL